jgi:hypothetical protein
MKTDHGLSDPDACESRKDIEIWILKDNVLSLCIGNDSVKISLEDFLTEIEQHCQDSLHNIFDKETERLNAERANDLFETLAEINRPDANRG